MKMKTKLLLPSIVLCAAMLIDESAHAANVNLAWDPNAPADAVTLYTVYEMFPATTNAVRLFTVTAPLATITNVLAGTHTYAVSASNVGGESLRSLPVTTIIPALATAPLNLRATITATITITVP